MIPVIILDTGPLGLVTKRVGIPAADACRQWLADCLSAGAAIYAPAFSYYEVRRELERAGNANGVLRLETFCAATPNRYLPFSDAALRLACTLWAQARNAGISTADPKELDCDVLIAAQALTMGAPPSDLVIATSNVGHLARYVNAMEWSQIVP